MNKNTRGGCWDIPADRLLMLLWLKATYPTGWQALWLKLARAWRS